jgi:hypothetical protein
MGGGASKAVARRKLKKQELAALAALRHDSVAAEVLASETGLLPLASPAPEPQPEPHPEPEPEPEPQPELATPRRRPVPESPSSQPTPPQPTPPELGPPPDGERVAALKAEIDKVQCIQRAWRRRCVRVSLKAGATAMSESRRKQKLAAVFGHYDEDKSGRLTRDRAVAMLSESADDEPPTEEGWRTLCGLLGVDAGEGISLSDLHRLYSPDVLGTTAAQHLDATLDRKFRALFPARASPMRGGGTATAGRLAGKSRRRRAKDKKRRKKGKDGPPEHETTELQLRRMESELRKLAEQDPEDADVRTLLDQTVAALEALRLEAQSSVDESATKPPADPGPEGEQWAALPHWAGEQALGARIAAQGAQLAVVQGADSADSADDAELTPASRIASLNTIAMEEMKIGQSASALDRLQEAWKLVQQAGSGPDGQPAEQTAHLRATTLHNLGLWAASFGGGAGAGIEMGAEQLSSANQLGNEEASKQAAAQVSEQHARRKQGGGGHPSGRKPSRGARSRSNGRTRSNERARSNERGRRPPSGLRGPQLGMGRDVSRLPRVQRGPARAHPSAVQSREESKVNVQDAAAMEMRPARSQPNRRSLNRPASAPANRRAGVGPAAAASRTRPSSARPIGRRLPAGPAGAGAADATGSPSDWSAPSIEDRRAFAVERHQSGLSVTEPKALQQMYGAGSSTAFRQRKATVGAESSDSSIPETRAAWDNADEEEADASSQAAAVSTAPVRPTDHETTRRSTRSPLVSSSLSSIGSTGSSVHNSPHGDWLSSTDVQPTGTGEALAARRLQMDTKPWRQTGRRRKPRPSELDTDQAEGQLPPETFLGGTFARMERAHKASEKVDAFWSTKVRPHESPTRSKEKLNLSHRSPDTTGRRYEDPAHAAVPADKRWTPGGAKLSPQKDRPRVSMAVPRHLKPVRPITLANDSPPSSPLRALGEHQARQAEMLKTPTAEEQQQQQQQADDNGNTEQGDGGAKLGQRQGQDGAAAAETEVSDDAVDAASPERSPNVSLGADMGLEEAVRVVTRGCLSIADVVRKSSGAAARRVSEIDANIANSRGAGPSGSAVVSVNVPAAEMKKRRSAVEANAQRMSAAAYILEKLHRTLDGEHLGANMVALREYADKAPRTPDVERNSAAVMVS